MLIVVSPAKSLDYQSPTAIETASRPKYMDQSALLIEQLRDMSSAELGQLMGISSTLADLNADRYRRWRLRQSRKNARQAIFAFTGDVYQGLQVSQFDENDLGYAQDHLRILSGLYGLLRPLDLMQAYRLEMGTRLATERGASLYDFWGDQISLELNKQLKKSRSKALLNLASIEYFSAVRPKLIKTPIVSPVFKDHKSGEYKIISFFAKKARGTMARWVIQNRVKERAELRHFDLEGYRFSEADSTPAQPVFLRSAA